jgi:hypothetical protein
MEGGGGKASSFDKLRMRPKDTALRFPRGLVLSLSKDEARSGDRD